MTGSCYLKALVLDEDCVYQKTIGEEEPWYARKVTAEGKFITEVEVSVGYQSDGLVCVSGINEGDYFDANLHVTNDSYVTIVGKSGSGKSTLLNILGLVEGYDGGAYIFNGVKIHNRTLQLFDK